MKLIIQIPCFNEAESLPMTVAALPRRMKGFDTVEWLIIDDGSTDGTAEVARRHGVDHIVTHPRNLGLARAFATGLDACLRLGADVIVNTDADNQYDGGAIPALIQPILEGRAEMVVGDRGVEGIEEFSWIKKRLQRLGSRVVRYASGAALPDATSGFRALSHHAAMSLNIVSSFSYTLESIIQAGHRKLATASVPVRTNPAVRESRLYGSLFDYLRRSAGTIVRITAMYRPMRAFNLVGALFLLGGIAIGLRFVYYYATGNGSGKVQSLLLAVILLVVGAQIVLAGLLAALISHNRQLVEDLLFRVRRIEIDGVGTSEASRAAEDAESRSKG